MQRQTTIAAYYYPGWHRCPTRDKAFPNGFSEWDMVFECQPRFGGHEQPLIPLWGRYDESDPRTFDKKIEAACHYGIDLFVFAFFWSRGLRLLEGALRKGFLENADNTKMRFALMWANRMPRRVLPVKDPQQLLIDPNRLVHTDPDDFADFVKHIAKRYFARENYYRLAGANYLSIFDTSFFLRQMGEEDAKMAIRNVREWLLEKGYGPLHLAAIDPIPEFWPRLRYIGFDSVTHYVFLPEWKGDRLQDFWQAAQRRSKHWQAYADGTQLPYFPSIATGWDASARALDYGKERPKRYPWSPVVTGRHPTRFEAFLKKGLNYTRSQNPDYPLCFISSWNEWSEGHYLEPDTTHRYAWLQAVRNAKNSCRHGLD